LAVRDKLELITFTEMLCASDSQNTTHDTQRLKTRLGICLTDNNQYRFKLYY